MSEEHQIVISVRGEARRYVDPDAGTLDVGVQVKGDTTAQARARGKELLDRLLGDLEALGGVVSTTDTMRAALSWTVRSISVHDDISGRDDYDNHGRRRGAAAWFGVGVTVRDFGLLGSLEEALTARAGFAVDGASWTVDPDNPIWPTVRADAVAAALRKAADYASALDGRVIGIEQISDAGLMEDSHARGRTLDFAFPASASYEGGESSMDPVPQTVTAVVDARLTAAVGVALPT